VTVGNDDEDEPSVARLKLAVLGDGVEPARLTEATGLSPTRAWHKGEPFESRGETFGRWTGAWELHADADKVVPAAEALVALVEPARDTLRETARAMSAKVVIAIWWEPSGGQGGFDVPAPLMRRLCDLADEIRFYFA
jgi:hypothetical protein